MKRESAFYDIEHIVPGDHLCCIYETEEEHRQVVSLFVRRGLEAGERVFYIVDTQLAETVLDYLREDGLDVDAYLQSGQFEIHGGNETYTLNGIFDPDAMISLLERETAKSLDMGYSAFRVTGEMSWALSGLPGTERLIEYENKLNRFLPAHKSVGLCQYDKRRFSPEVLLDVLRIHPHAIIGTEAYSNFYYLPPEKLLGEKPVESELELWIHNLKEYSTAQRELEESRESYRNLYNSIRDAILVADTERRIIHCNQAFTDIFGYSLEEIEGKKSASVYADFEDFENLGNKLEGHEDEELLFSVHYQKKNGEVFTGETKVFTLKDTNGRKEGFIGIIRDISESERVERELRREQKYTEAILESSGAIILMIDPSGTILRVNSTCLELSGYTEEELRSLPFQSLVPEDEWERVLQVFDELLSGNFPNTYENHWITKSGDRRFIAWTNTVVKAETGEIETIISTGLDITERQREMERRVERLEEELRSLESLSASGGTTTTGRMYAQKVFRESNPDDYQRLQKEYEAILSDRLEERIYKTDNSISPRLKRLAEGLGFASVGPKDVVELHVRSLKELSRGVSYKRAQAITEEGRLLAIELMGYLVSFYRNQVAGEKGREK